MDAVAAGATGALLKQQTDEQSGEGPEALLSAAEWREQTAKAGEDVKEEEPALSHEQASELAKASALAAEQVRGDAAGIEGVCGAVVEGG